MLGIRVILLAVISALTWTEICAQQARTFRYPEGYSKDNYDPGTIMIKIKSSQANENLGFGAKGTDRQRDLLQLSDLTRVTRTIAFEPLVNSSSTPLNGRVRTSKYLEGIYKLTLETGADLKEEINKLLRFKNVIYAEPIFLETPLLTPNDPSAHPTTGAQAHLGVIKAYDAWDLQQGDPNISVAVIDTGVDPDHPDLVDNLLLNSDDPINGIDDDNDGLIDNLQGYDFADEDNDPTADNSGHGVLVHGLSSATTDNGTGIAGTGFNSTFVPYKIFRSSDNTSNNSYQAVLTAAQLGHQVMNLSWGSKNTFSQFNQDIINSAVLDYDAVIIAAAGNDNDEGNWYPASYENVISVASTSNDDTKSSFSTFNYEVDISAPGTSNFTTTNGNGYGFSGGGTSFASPLVAGAGALLKAEFPHWTAQQIMEQLRVTSDDIYSEGSNNTYFGKLGTGRLNMFEALQDTSYKSVRLTSFDYDNGFGQFAFYSDTISLNTSYENFLQPTNDVVVTISSTSPYVTMLTNGENVGSLATLESFDPGSNLQLILTEDTPPNESIDIRFDFSDDGYNDWQFKRITTSPDFINFGTSDLDLTVSGNSNLGYQSDVLTNGIGMMYQGNASVESLGLIISADGTIINNSINDFDGNTRDFDFATEKNIRLFNNSTADSYALSFLNDSDAGTEETGLHIEQKALSWGDPADRQYIILEYRISNISGSTISDLKLAVFSDWMLDINTTNSIAWDLSNKLGYGSSAANSKEAGVALLTDQSPIFYAIDKGSENGNTPDLGTTFSKAEKLTFISGGVAKEVAGTGGGNDVAQLLGAELGTLADGESVKAAFMIAAGENTSELQAAVTQASSRYDHFLNNPPVDVIDTVCLDQPTTINLTSGTSFDFYSDAQGADLLHSGNDFTTGILDKDTTFYIQNTDNSFKSDMRSISIKTNDIQPVVDIDDFYFLGDDPNNVVHFSDNTFKAVSWQWDFDNGSGSTGENPSSQFDQVGDYQVTVDITDKFGCEAQFSKMLQVRERGPAAIFEQFTVCQDQSATISSVDLNTLRVYTSPTAETAIYEGQEFNSDPLPANTTFYISNIDPEFESVRVPVTVNVIELEPVIEYRPDTTDLTNKNLIQFIDQSLNTTSGSWKINGVVRNEVNPIVDITGLTQITVELSVQGSNGCANIKTENIIFTNSTTPVIDDMVVCPDDNFEIKPTSGNYFYFYSDPELNHLVHKGSSYSPIGVNNDTTFYVTGIDNLYESSAQTVNIDLVPFQVDFTISPNPLILGQDNLVELTDLSLEATSWNWFIDDEFIEAAQNPALTFNAPGSREVRLQARNDQGCVLESTRTLEVQTITALPDLRDQILLYPNPAEESFTIELSNPEANAAFQLLDLTARVVLTGELSDQFNQISLNDVKPGVYTIRIMHDEGVELERLIVR